MGTNPGGGGLNSEEQPVTKTYIVTQEILSVIEIRRHF